ncbi:hypothetical protein QQZ08_002488 [Neonectria magnoliae]|uniref:Putative gamma-glutamylcyclotransferase n=1 Tax=Neonectria magnoliae TaxID=2732573 RepID=A0ABR1IBJ5_9HYPO
MDVLDILESMVQTASLHDDSKEPDHTTIRQWQQLFGYSFSEAERKIKEHRSDDDDAPVVSDAHWEMIRYRDDLMFYDKEAYEHSLKLSRRAALKRTKTTPVQKNRHGNPSARPVTYLIKLDGPLSTVDSVMTAGCLSIAPKFLQGTDSSGGPAAFCEIDAPTKAKIETSVGFNDFRPTFIRYSKASKDLSPISRAPTLGIDSTMPQYRCDTATSAPSPSQDQFPVWYFFYGTLADSAILARVFGDEQHQKPPAYDYRSAVVRGGLLKLWGGRYRALLDDPSGGCVAGSALLVMDENQEDALRVYETDQYEVVRCTIEMDRGSVEGLTFRFVGETD